MDSHPLARDLAHDHLQHPPRPARLCFSGRGKRDIFSHRDGARHLVHNPDCPAPHIPASPGGALQARTLLPRRWVARVGREPQLHRLDAVRLCDILAADGSACDEGHDELCGRDHGECRPSGHVRSSPLFFYHFLSTELFLFPRIWYFAEYVISLIRCTGGRLTMMTMTTFLL